MQHKELNPTQIERFVRNKIDHSYNKEVFDKQLNQEIEKNLMKMQKNIVKQLKRKLIFKQQQQTSLEQRQRIKKQLEEKFDKARQKKQKQMQQKQKNILQDHKHRKELFQQRIEQLKKAQKSKRQQILQMIENKEKQRPSYNKLNRAVSLLEQPHYQRKLQIQEDQYKRIKEKVEQKQVFKRPKLQKRQISLMEIRPKQNIYDAIEKQRINKMGEHLQRIQQSRRKREQLINQKITNMKMYDKQSSQLRSERLKSMLESQKKKQQDLISKLSKSATIQVSSSRNNSLPRLNRNPQSTQKLVKGSIIYEQGQDREKHSYRKQIKEQIKQYMIKQKQKLLSGQ